MRCNNGGGQKLIFSPRVLAVISISYEKNMEKTFKYASMPMPGTLSRKLRKGVSLQISRK